MVQAQDIDGQLVRAANRDRAAIGDIGEQIVLAAHYPFGFASGTGSVHDGRQVVALHRLESRRQAVCAGAAFEQLAKVERMGDPGAAVVHHDQLLQSRQLPLEIDQAAGNRRVLNKGGPALRMAEHFDKHTIGKTRCDDDVGKTAGESRQVGGEPGQTIFTDDGDGFTRCDTDSAQAQQHLADEGGELAPGNLLERFAGL